jgi:spore coat polysaccharide biosynthesis protein SpsF
MGKIVAIVQARIHSTRLKSKIFYRLAGKCVLDHVVSRLSLVPGVDQVVVATPDQQVVDYCWERGIDYFLGDENDVLDRYYWAARHFQADTVIRVTSDCPLIDPGVVQGMIDCYESNRLDFLTVEYYGHLYGSKAGFPDGTNAEIFDFALLETMWRLADDPFEREHVTPYVRRHLPEKVVKYRIPLKGDYPNVDLSTLHLSLDTHEDYLFLKRIFESPHDDIDQVLRTVDRFSSKN